MPLGPRLRYVFFNILIFLKGLFYFIFPKELNNLMPKLASYFKRSLLVLINSYNILFNFLKYLF
jgi:hypothetical protein